MVNSVRLFGSGCKIRVAEHVDFLAADAEDRPANAAGALSPAQQLQPETLDIEAQAPVKIGNNEAT